LIPNPIGKVLSTFPEHRVRALLMGGQACILYGAAEFSRDVDVAVLASEANLRQVGRNVLRHRSGQRHELLGMVLASEVHLLSFGCVYCAKLHHDNDKRCIFCHADESRKLAGRYATAGVPCRDLDSFSTRVQVIKK
jgi:hypothetical protein